MAVMIAETIPDTSREPSSERRIVGCALRSWEELRTGESFPLHGECLASFDRRLQPGVILIEINDHVEDDIILDCGPDLIDALGRDPIGQAVQTVLPSSTQQGLIFWRVAAELKKPIADVGRFTNTSGVKILYRCIFLPVSEENGRITRLLGAFSYRIVH